MSTYYTIEPKDGIIIADVAAAEFFLSREAAETEMARAGLSETCEVVSHESRK